MERWKLKLALRSLRILEVLMAIGRLERVLPECDGQLKHSNREV